MNKYEYLGNWDDLRLYKNGDRITIHDFFIEVEKMQERIDKLEKGIVTLVEANNNTFL